MDATLEAIQDVVAAEAEAGAQPGMAQPDDGATETRLTQEISDLWSHHLRLSETRRATSKKLRQVRARLAERLHEMKSLLSRPGRGGQWRSWLRERGIPRSTADRLVARYAEVLGSHNGNVPSGAIPDPPEDSAERLAKSVWQRCSKLLTSDESVLQFIGCIVTASGITHEERAEGLMVFNPVPKTADEVPASDPDTCTAPQLPGEVPATTDGGAATPTGAVQAPAAADAGSGAVV